MNTNFDALLEQAVAASQEARWSEASTCLAAAAELRPEAPEPHYLRAANFAATGDLAAAEAEFSACLALAPHLAIARFQFGLLYVTTGRPDAARSVWQPLLATQHAFSWFARAMLAILHGDRASAETWIRQGMQANHENAPLNTDMAELLAKLAELDTDHSVLGRPEAKSGSVQEDKPVEQDSATHLLIASYTQR